MTLSHVSAMYTVPSEATATRDGYLNLFGPAPETPFWPMAYWNTPDALYLLTLYRSVSARYTATCPTRGSTARPYGLWCYLSAKPALFGARKSPRPAPLVE